MKGAEMRKLLLTMSLLLGLTIGVQSSGVSASALPGAARPPSGDVEPAKAMVTSIAGGTPTQFTEAGDVPNGIAGGYVYVPVNPYRTFDSRSYTNGFLPGGWAMYFDVITDASGAARIPSNAVAVTYNLAVTNTAGSGFLGIYPANIGWPGNASINWMASGTTLSNGGTVAIGFGDAAGQIEVYAGPAAAGVGTDFVIDITGYYV